MLGLIKTLAIAIGLMLPLVSIFFFIRFRSRRWVYLVVVKMLDNSLAPYLALVGVFIVILGLLCSEPITILGGMIGVLASTQYIIRVTKPHSNFTHAFGPDWLEKMSPAMKERTLPKRWTWRLPNPKEFSLEQDVAFWTIPNSTRKILCDIWHPSSGIPNSGIGLIYLHGSAWHYGDKDYGTRPLFAQLTAQGHVVMDVAYRLCPEVNLMEMVGDVKRAIAWMKGRADEYGIDPEKIVLAGGSAGAHLALLAAYTALDPNFTPGVLLDTDVSVQGVVSYYGPADLPAFFRDGFGRINTQHEVEKIQNDLLGGLLEDIPEAFAHASPVTYIRPGCPATLIFQGEHDMGVPVESTRTFFHLLVSAGVPAVYVEFPQTDHGFDIQMRVLKLGDGSQVSPAAQAALYDLERFLALMASDEPDLSRHLSHPSFIQTIC